MPAPRVTLLLACLLIPMMFGSVTAQENWPRFRGVDANSAVADDPRLPDTWNKTTNVKWKAEIPGSGWGSPIVWGDRVFVSSVHSDADYEKPKAGLYLGRGRPVPPDTIHHWMVYCLSLKTGKLIWKHETHSGKPKMPRHPKSSYAAETPTTDGKRLYVLFGDLGLYCYDLGGKLLWTHAIAPRKTQFGYGAAASPVVEGGQVIYVYDNHESSYIEALDGATGKSRWKVKRDEKSTWATPFVWNHAGGTEIVVAGRKENRAYSPDGDLLWHFDGRMSVLTIPSPLVADGLLYITSGYFQDQKRPVFAVAPGGRGNIALKTGQTSNEHIRWSLQKMGPYNTSPIVYKGRYFTLLDRGMATCHDAETGKLIHNRVRFPRGASFTSSPWAYNGKIFCLDERGTTHVIPADGKFRVERTNPLGELCLATPSIAQGRLLIRTVAHVYCIGK